MAEKLNTSHDETIEGLTAYFVNVIHDSKDKSDLLETVLIQLQDMEIRETLHAKEDEELKAELKRAKETNADMASMNASWTQEKKHLSDELGKTLEDVTDDRTRLAIHRNQPLALANIFV